MNHLLLTFLYTSNLCEFGLILDDKMPFVPLEKEYEVVFIREGERVVIPCRGSMENLNVTLHTVRESCIKTVFVFT